MHTEEKAITSQMNKSAFAESSDIKTEVQIQPAEKSFSCEVCGSAFTHNSMLKVHMRKHTGENHLFVRCASQHFQRVLH